MLKRVLKAEQQISRVVNKTPKKTKRTIGRRVAEVASMHPVAARALKCITNPAGDLALHWPGGARDSVKIAARLRTSFSLEAGNTSLLFPLPGISSDVVSFAQYTSSNATPLWESTSTLNNAGAGVSVTTRTFAELPFSVDNITDGVQVRCLAYHVKLKYAGPLLNRSGTVMFYENPEKDFLSGDARSHTTALSAYMQDQLNTPIHTRRVNFTDSPVVEHTFHPFLWKGASSASPSQDGWVQPQMIGTELSYSQPAYPAGGEIYNAAFALSRAYAGCGYIAVASPVSAEILVEITAHYEFGGGVARPLSTPTPSAPHEDITHVRAAILKGKMRNCLNPDGNIQHLAVDAVKEIMGAKKAAVIEGAAAKLIPRGTSAMGIAAGIAGLML